MRKLMLAAVLAVAAAFAMPAFASNSCAALDNEITAAANDATQFVNNAINSEQQAAINSALEAIVADAQARGLSGPDQLAPPAKAVFNAVYAVFEAATPLNAAAEEAMLIRYALGNTCNNPQLVTQLREKLAIINDPNVRNAFTTSVNNLLAAVAAYNRS